MRGEGIRDTKGVRGGGMEELIRRGCMRSTYDVEGLRIGVYDISTGQGGGDTIRGGRRGNLR